MGSAMRLAESVIAGFLLILGGFYSYGILQIQGREFTSNEIGPAAFPWLLVTLLVILSGSLLVGRRFRSSRRGEGEDIKEGGAAGWKIPAAALLLIAYVGSFEYVGFLWSTPVFLGLLSPLYGIRRLSLVAIVGMAVGFTAALYSFLWQLFGVLLP